MALGRTGPLDALSAVFVSQQSALGSRVVRIEGGRMPPNTAAIPERINGFYASRADVERLALALERRHRGRLHTGIRNLDDETVYVKDLEHYWLGHQCNHVTLRWLAKLGCDVRGLLPTSHFRLGSFRQ